MTFSWLSSEDNGKAVTKTKVFYSSNNGTSWYGASGIYQDASGSRSVSAQIMRLGRFTISDSINALEITSYPLQVTALSQGLWNGSVTVQDTFTVELHAGTSPYGLAATGKVLSTTAGVLAMTLSGVTNDVSYYVVIKGRNVLETWSASPVALSAGGTAYDFTTAANQAYGSNQILKGGKYCLYAGDVDQSGAIDTTDLRLIDQDAVKYTSLDYVGQYATDLDGNKFVDSDDLLLCDNNVYNSVAVSRPPVIVNPPSTKAARPGLQNQTKEKKSNQ
jgi:hypothetical protein